MMGDTNRALGRAVNSVKWAGCSAKLSPGSDSAKRVEVGSIGWSTRGVSMGHKVGESMGSD